MNKDLIINQTIDHIFNNIEAILKKESLIKQYNKLSKPAKRKLIELIADTQSRSIKIAMENQMSIGLPYLGTIKIKPGRLQAVNIKDDTLKKHNIEDYDALSDDEKEELKLEYTEKIRQQFLKNKLKKKQETPFNRHDDRDLPNEGKELLKNLVNFNKNT